MMNAIEKIAETATKILGDNETSLARVHPGSVQTYTRVGNELSVEVIDGPHQLVIELDPLYPYLNLGFIVDLASGKHFDVEPDKMEAFAAYLLKIIND